MCDVSPFNTFFSWYLSQLYATKTMSIYIIIPSILDYQKMPACIILKVKIFIKLVRPVNEASAWQLDQLPQSFYLFIDDRTSLIVLFWPIVIAVLHF